jgi:hypothetical protein
MRIDLDTNPAHNAIPTKNAQVVVAPHPNAVTQTPRPGVTVLGYDNVQIATNGTDVTIRDAFVGPKFETMEGETLGVCMRDSGFEVTYQTPGHGSSTVSFNNGAINVAGQMFWRLAPDMLPDSVDEVVANVMTEARRIGVNVYPEQRKALFDRMVSELAERGMNLVIEEMPKSEAESEGDGE